MKTEVKDEDAGTESKRQKGTFRDSNTPWREDAHWSLLGSLAGGAIPDSAVLWATSPALTSLRDIAYPRVYFSTLERHMANNSSVPS